MRTTAWLTFVSYILIYFCLERKKETKKHNINKTKVDIILICCCLINDWAESTF